MIGFINSNFSLRHRIALYRMLYTLNEMDFSYLRPVFAGTVMICLFCTRFFVPESYILSLTGTELALYHTALVFSGLCFLIFLRPFVRKLICRFRVYLYRRKKRATRTLFRFS
jgi:hypothetical protein